MDFVMSLVSNMLFVFFSISIFSFRRRPTFGIEMRWQFLLIVLISEILAYYYISDVYVVPEDAYQSVGFFQDNQLLYWRGILPLQFLQWATRHFIHFKDEPTIAMLFSALGFDYLFFLLLSETRRYRKMIKANKKKKVKVF